MSSCSLWRKKVSSIRFYSSRYEIARNQDVQKKLQEEIDEAFGVNKVEDFDYKTVQGLPYLDMVIHEALRLYSPVGAISRACIQDYT